MLYITSLVLIYLMNGSLYPLNTFIQFPLPHPPTLVTKNLNSFSKSVFVLFVFEVKLTYHTMLFLVHDLVI